MWWVLSQREVRKKAYIRNRYKQVPNLTQNTTWDSDKTNKKTSHTRESKQVTKRPHWTDKTACQTRNINSKNDLQKQRCLGTVSNFTGGLITNLILISDVDQDK